MRTGTDPDTPGWLKVAWIAVLALAVGVRVWNALRGEMMWGYDAWGHVAHMLFIDLHHAFPWADQGWSYYQPPLHYVLGAALAQLGSGESLVRGLSLLAGAASLGCAGLAARVARWASPERPGLAVIAFCAVAFLPVQIYLGGMPGNELGVALLNIAAITSFVATQRREEPGLAGDFRTGVLLALALLTKHTGLVGVASVGGSLLLGAVVSGDLRGELRRLAPRSLVLTVTLLVIAGPHYANNLTAYGKPIPTNRDYPLVSSVERPQPPGERRFSDYFRFPPRMFTEANPLAPHMLRSIWGTTYMTAWAEIHRESDRGRALEAERSTPAATTAIAVLGLLPTLLAGGGALLALGDLLRGRRRWLYLPLWTLSGVMLAAYGLFLWNVPIWAAVKSAYCLTLSLPFALFLLRGLEGLEAMAKARNAPRAAVAAALVALGAVAVAAAGIATSGAVLPPRRDSPAMGAVHYHFGELESAKRIYAPYVAAAGYKGFWLENLAAVELAMGNAPQARRLYERADALAERAGLADPHRSVRIAVASALAGDLDSARNRLDASVRERDLPEARANRGAVRAALGDLAGAESDFVAALELEPALSPAIHNLLQLRSLGASSREIPACVSPRAYPYGVGTGEVVEWGIGRRPLLLLGDTGLELAEPAFYRGACARLATATRLATRTTSTAAPRDTGDTAVATQSTRH